MSQARSWPRGGGGGQFWVERGTEEGGILQPPESVRALEAGWAPRQTPPSLTQLKLAELPRDTGMEPPRSILTGSVSVLQQDRSIRSKPNLSCA